MTEVIDYIKSQITSYGKQISKESVTISHREADIREHEKIIEECREKIALWETALKKLEQK